jgi:3-oxoadipate enol-lactonase
MPDLLTELGNVQFTDAGTGPAVMLVHGFPLDGRIWGDVAAMLSAKFRVIVPDLPGFGRSGHATRAFSMDDLGRTLATLGDHLKLDRFAAAGLSMGGYVLQGLVRVAPERLSALSLVDTRANADDEKGRAGRDAMAKTAREQGPAAVAEKMMPNMLHSSAYAGDPALADRLRDMILDQQGETLAKASEAMRDRPAFWDLLPKLPCPLQVIVGDDDRIAPLEVAKEIASKAKNARLDVIPRAGHMAPLERPDAVAEAIEKFLSAR